MPIQTTQKFSSPSQDEGKFLSQLERYSQSVALALNEATSYDYVGVEQATGSSFLATGTKSVPVYVQSMQSRIASSINTFSLSTQSPNKGIVFLSASGFVSVGSNSYMVPYSDGTNAINVFVNSSGQITVNATSLFVGGTISLTVLYAYLP